MTSAKENKRYSREQERRVAHLLGGRRHALSGSDPNNKGDGHVGDDVEALDYILLECKRTQGTKQITIKDNDLRKHRREAGDEGREPVVAFELAGSDYAVVDLHYLAELLDTVRSLTPSDRSTLVNPNCGECGGCIQCTEFVTNCGISA